MCCRHVRHCSRRASSIRRARSGCPAVLGRRFVGQEREEGPLPCPRFQGIDVPLRPAGASRWQTGCANGVGIPNARPGWRAHRARSPRLRAARPACPVSPSGQSRGLCARSARGHRTDTGAAQTTSSVSRRRSAPQRTGDACWSAPAGTAGPRRSRWRARGAWASSQSPASRSDPSPGASPGLGAARRPWPPPPS